MTVAPPPTTPSPRRQLARDAAALLLVFGTVGALAFGLVWPWLPHPPAGGQALARYAPVRDGYARLFARYGAGGELLGWESQNFRFVAPLRLFDDLRKAAADAILRVYEADRPEVSLDEFLRRRLADVQVVEARSRELDVDGQVRETVFVVLREPRGELLVTIYNAGQDQQLSFDPPILSLPADLGPSSAWRSEGRRSDGADYVFEGRVVAAGPSGDRRSDVEDCLKIETRLSFSRGGTAVFELPSSGWYCADVGGVGSEAFDASGNLTTRSVVVASEGMAAETVALPPAVFPAPSLPDAAGSTARATSEAADPAAWELARMGRAVPTGRTTESTVPPSWIPTDPPVVLAAGHGGDLVAIDAGDPSSVIRWRFHPGGTVYGPPAFDPVGGRIYFGATDKRLYALDARGLFLWTFRVDDNIAGRPLVAGDTVIFGSEDRTVYGVDAATGELRWKVPTSLAVVSSPALAGDPASGRAVVVIGSDDGGVYGIDPTSGEQRWLATLDGPIEAPIVADGERVYVAARKGSLAAIDVAECEDTCEPAWTADLGVLRTAPAVGAERVFVVSDDGYLIALDREDGRRLWQDQLGRYVGPPALVGEVLVVAGSDGTIHRMSADGAKLGAWSASAASSPTDALPAFLVGPSAGGDALWLVDRDSVVRRLGPPFARVDAELLPLSWFLRNNEPPFGGNNLLTTVVQYAGRAVVLDFGRRIILVDPATGAWERRGTLPSEDALVRLDPVVAEDGETLLAVAGDTLHAVNLADGSPRWQFRGEGIALRPPVAAGNRVLWLTGQVPAGADGPQPRDGTLYALDAASGALLWQAVVGPFAFPGGAVVGGDTVFLSTRPHALDLATGTPRFAADLPGLPVGGPALSAAGDALFVGQLVDGARGVIAALDTADGRPRWVVDLGEGQDEALNFWEPIWVSDGTLVVPSISGKVFGLDAATGAERWRHQPPAPRLGTLTVAGGRVWQVLDDGRVYALDAASGRTVLRYTALQMNLSGANFVQRPALIGNRLIVPVGQLLLAFDVSEAGR